MRLVVVLAAIMAPSIALAAGGMDPTPPKPTETTQQCQNGTVWDEKSGSCVAPQESSLDDDTLYGAAREFAYAGQYENAQRALRAMSDQTEDRVLTYLGFTSRKMGNVQAGMTYYAAALEKNPDNHLARSYMGQAYVQAGQLDLARAQLTEIRARGGRGTWAEVSLRLALESGRGYAY
ncbi:tetratricopeptide repeat protein [Pseudaestuariivita rosea]|uniref:tetratricopeptide repeat protein n=1 Tax=Pseudaestuariivita rosea TaxID=2763263 RepID=UPI001ABAC3EE|nr:tetratricopeptide repeat protein [Pseudaestuariivita rosea]